MVIRRQFKAQASSKRVRSGTRDGIRAQSSNVMGTLEYTFRIPRKMAWTEYRLSLKISGKDCVKNLIFSQVIEE